MALSKEQLARYRRNIVIPAIGDKGQEKLLDSKVLIVGTGGLGSSCAYYLAAAGIGKIGLVDFDLVELDNLQRQILHATGDIGKSKVTSAKDKLSNLNPEIEIIPHKVKLSSENILDIVKDYNLLVECSDNSLTKYLLNDTSIFTKKPLFYAAALRFEGQAMTILPGKTACYRCLFPKLPSENEFISPKDAGILGVVAGIIGLIQANEVLKYILNIGELLTDKLLIFDSLTTTFRKIKVQLNPKCPVCGRNPTIRGITGNE
ncbi:MAG: HesA/MoeB/ThiF family protein [Candidatus Omnitrophica bacterium]|nr:HesA/MoeB/ThiF family protein [Candidatus Omnitrophota bacterium]